MTTIIDSPHLQLVSGSIRKKSQVRQSDAEECVSISHESTMLSKAEGIAQSSPDIDEARIEEIKQAIRNGDLKIDHEKLAHKMLEFELSLFDH